MGTKQKDPALELVKREQRLQLDYLDIELKALKTLVREQPLEPKNMLRFEQRLGSLQTAILGAQAAQGKSAGPAGG